MKLHLTAIVAMTANRVIGRDGVLPWHLPEDLAFFKRTTLGHPVLMGRKTFESIGRPLPKRQNIVLTRNLTWSAPGVHVIHQPAELPKTVNQSGTVFIIGGADVYAAFFPLLDDLIISHVFEETEGDTYFPEFKSVFPKSEVLETHSAFEVMRWSRA